MRGRVAARQRAGALLAGNQSREALSCITLYWGGLVRLVSCRADPRGELGAAVQGGELGRAARAR